MCWRGSRGKDSHSGNTSDSALDVLNKRYAQGEISKEEYEEKRSVITRHN
ncbi:MAG: SHOCT domain-containing protein [Thermodesulfovibrionales bacterium]